MSTPTRDELAHAMARAEYKATTTHGEPHYSAGDGDTLDTGLSDTDRHLWLDSAAAALPVAVEAVLARFEAMHRARPWHRATVTGGSGVSVDVGGIDCRACRQPYPCPTVRLCQQVRDEWGAS